MVEFRARGVVKDVEGKDVLINERLCRRDFVQMIRPYLDRTVDGCLAALRKAHMSVDQVSEILLVGGSSYGPWVRDTLEASFPAISPKLFRPDLCVGIGAAIHANAILPKRLGSDVLSILLDAPERSVLDTANITGVITAVISDKSDWSVVLRDGRGREIATASTDCGGGFAFFDVELTVEDADNHFVIAVRDGDCSELLASPVVIRHEIRSSDTSTVVTVLPRPIFVETYDGMVPLAPEGVALPARIQKTFQRLNDNPNIELSLYQGTDVIGQVRIEGLPEEAGRGTLVDLQVEVTAKNEILGTAVFRSSAGEKFAERPVLVHYNIVEVPPAEALRDRLLALTARIAQGGTTDTDDQSIPAEILSDAAEVLRRAERLLTLVPMERQEILAHIQECEGLLNPARDDMRPKRHEFARVCEKCRQRLEEMEIAARGLAAHRPTGEDLDPSMVQSSDRTTRKVDDYRNRLQKVEIEGRDAWERRDRRRWLQAYDKLTDIEALVSSDEQRETEPTPVNKLLARREVVGLLSKFHTAITSLKSRGNIGDWINELRRIHDGLLAALLALDDLDDSLDNESGLAAVRLIFTRQVASINEDIGKIGQTVKSVTE